MATPAWLLEMRAISGLSEKPGVADEPKILAMAQYIGNKYPEMKAYCDQYHSDSTPWCGLAEAYCMAKSDIRPPFKKGSDTDCFLWAQAWADDLNFVKLASPREGAIVVMKRSGGGHVTTFEKYAADGALLCRGGNQSDKVNVQSFPKSNVIAYVWPKDAPTPVPEPKPPEERRVLRKGDTGEDVRVLQTALGVPADGDFGGVTEAQVKALQAACDIDIDGVVGPGTWSQVDHLLSRLAAGDEGLTAVQIDEIVSMVEEDPVSEFNWPDRGKAPPGYMSGMCLAFAVAYVAWVHGGDSAADLMARAAGGPDADALKWYEDEFEELGMDNSRSGADTLRHLWALLIGLGMRESSGRYSEGRDLSATNVAADTAEAGLFQQSWNSRAASPTLAGLLNIYWNKPDGFLSTFSEGINPTASDLSVFGTGSGATFQFLAKYCPLFACMSAAVGLRVIRKHWGPINRKEVFLSESVEELLYRVQVYMEKDIDPLPPVPDETVPSVDIVTEGEVRIVVNGKVVS